MKKFGHSTNIVILKIYSKEMILNTKTSTDKVIHCSFSKRQKLEASYPLQFSINFQVHCAMYHMIEYYNL